MKTKTEIAPVAKEELTLEEFNFIVSQNETNIICNALDFAGLLKPKKGFTLKMVKNIVNRFAKNKGMDIKLTKKALICLLCEMGFLKGENTSKVVMANPKNINFLYIGKKGIRMEVLILDLILRKLEIMLPTQDIIEIPINGELTLQYNTITQSFNIEKLLRDTNNDLDLNEWLEGVSNEIRSFQYRGINGDIFGNAEMLDHILEMYVNEFDEIVTALEKYELAF